MRRHQYLHQNPIFTRVHPDGWSCAGCFLPISVDVSLVSLWWADGRRDRNTHSQTGTWCFFSPMLCVYSSFFKKYTSCLWQRCLILLIHKAEHAALQRIYSGIFALLRSILVETNLKYSWAFALFTLFEGDGVYSISTIWRFKIYLFSLPFVRGCKFMTLLLWELHSSSKKDFRGSDSIIWNCFIWFQTACPRFCPLVFLVWL